MLPVKARQAGNSRVFTIPRQFQDHELLLVVLEQHRDTEKATQAAPVPQSDRKLTPSDTQEYSPPRSSRALGTNPATAAKTTQSSTKSTPTTTMAPPTPASDKKHTQSSTPQHSTSNPSNPTTSSTPTPQKNTQPTPRNTPTPPTTQKHTEEDNPYTAPCGKPHRTPEGLKLHLFDCLTCPEIEAKKP